MMLQSIYGLNRANRANSNLREQLEHKINFLTAYFAFSERETNKYALVLFPMKRMQYSASNEQNWAILARFSLTQFIFASELTPVQQKHI